jgi:hypothetical protein
MVPADFVVRNVAIFIGEMLKERNGIRRAKSAKGKPQKIPLKTGRKAVSGTRTHSFT